jgi:TatD DNase family protein
VISLIDTHCHIDLPAFDEDREAMLSRAREAGVRAMIVIGHNRERWRASAALSERYPNLARTAGLHPNDAENWSEALLWDLEAELASGEPVAVGETGLDFFRDAAPVERQREAFAAQIDLACRHGLPIVIHQRSAEQQVLEMLRDHGPVRGVMHCFSGDAAFARLLRIQNQRTYAWRWLLCRWIRSSWKPTLPIWHRSRGEASATNHRT